MWRSLCRLPRKSFEGACTNEANEANEGVIFNASSKLPTSRLIPPGMAQRIHAAVMSTLKVIGQQGWDGCDCPGSRTSATACSLYWGYRESFGLQDLSSKGLGVHVYVKLYLNGAFSAQIPQKPFKNPQGARNP